MRSEKFYRNAERAGRPCSRGRSADSAVLPATRVAGQARPQSWRSPALSTESVTVLRVIKAAQRLGFTLDEVADLLQTGRHRHGHVDASLRLTRPPRLPRSIPGSAIFRSSGKPSP